VLAEQALEHGAEREPREPAGIELAEKRLSALRIDDLIARLPLAMEALPVRGPEVRDGAEYRLGDERGVELDVFPRDLRGADLRFRNQSGRTPDPAGCAAKGCRLSSWRLRRSG
jgi:hypothetical protein